MFYDEKLACGFSMTSLKINVFIYSQRLSVMMQNLNSSLLAAAGGESVNKESVI